MVHPSASAARIASSTAARFSTGSAPGSPRHTGHTCVLGGAPNVVLQPQKIFDAVRSWAWISRPMTGSNRMLGARERAWSGVGAGGQDVGADARLEDLEIVAEHPRKLPRLRIVCRAVGPRVPRSKD